MRFSALITVIACTLFLSACARENGKYSVITTKQISLYKLNPNDVILAKDIKETSSRHVAIIIPFSKTPTISSAVDEILQQYNGDYLSNVDVIHRSFQLMWLYHYSAWEIEGDVMRIRK